MQRIVFEKGPFQLFFCNQKCWESSKSTIFLNLFLFIITLPFVVWRAKSCLPCPEQIVLWHSQLLWDLLHVLHHWWTCILPAVATRCWWWEYWSLLEERNLFPENHYENWILCFLFHLWCLETINQFIYFFIDSFLQGLFAKSKVFQSFERESSLRTPVTSLSVDDSSGWTSIKPVLFDKWSNLSFRELISWEQILKKVYKKKI